VVVLEGCSSSRNRSRIVSRDNTMCTRSFCISNSTRAMMCGSYCHFSRWLVSMGLSRSHSKKASTIQIVARTGCSILTTCRELRRIVKPCLNEKKVGRRQVRELQPRRLRGVCARRCDLPLSGHNSDSYAAASFCMTWVDFDLYELASEGALSSLPLRTKSTLFHCRELIGRIST
jgi:hypothetical protein